MKNKIPTIAVLFLLALALSGCAGSAAPKDAGEDTAAYSANAPQTEMDASDVAAQEMFGVSEGAGTGANDDVFSAGSAASAATLSDKIIYTASAELETLEFDETLDGVYDLVDAYGGFIESSYVSGTNYRAAYYGSGGNRNADFTIRVPREAFGDMKNALSKLGNVLYLSSAAQNVTAQYTDTDSRLTACRIEEERLLAMLEKAETVEEMLAVESRLTDVRYEIESLTTTLNSLDSQVSYSTVNLRIYEVEEITDTSADKGYWEDVADTLAASLSGVGGFFKGFLKYAIAALPVLLILAVLALPGLLVLRRRRKARGQSGKRDESRDS